MKISVMDMMKSSCEEEESVPAEMIFEILTRISSSKALDSCKFVSKTWRQLITNDHPDFMSVWCNRTNNLSGYIIQAHNWRDNTYASTIVSVDGRKIKIGLDDDGGEMKLLASCRQGICCYEKVIHGYEKNRWFACKPATQQFQPLPNPKLKFLTAGVGITVLRSNPLRYKIVRLSSSPYGFRTQYVCEIFDSEIWSWRWINGVSTPARSNSFFYELDPINHSLPAVCIGMSFYWQTNGGNVLKFDVCSESLMKFRSPVAPSDWSCMQELFECEGSLGLSSFIGKSIIKLWILQDQDQEQGGWTYRGGIDMTSLQQFHEEDLQKIEYVRFYTTQILFIRTFNQTFLYRLDRQSFITHLDFGYRWDRYGDRLFQFQSDLDIVNLKPAAISSVKKDKL